MNRNYVGMLIILLIPSIAAADPTDPVGAIQTVTISGTITPTACTVTIPANFVIDLDEATITNAATGADMADSDLATIEVSNCAINTSLAIASSNASPHPFANDATTELATGVDSVAVRLTSSTTNIILNTVSISVGTTNAAGDTSIPLTASAWKTSQAYNNEQSFSATIDLQLQEL